MKRRALLLAALTASFAGSARANNDGAEKKKGGGQSFIQIPTMVASIIRPGGRRGVLTVETGIDVPDTALHARAAASQPRLRDAYSRFLMTYAGSLGPGLPPNADYISRELQRHTDLVLGRPGAKLLLGTILMN